MKKLFYILLLLFPLSVKAQPPIKSYKKLADGLWLMYFDTTKGKGYVTKSTIVEFKDFIVLIELSLSTDGAGATNLKDHTDGAEMVLAALREKFPNKPLKYVLSTHWHPHSISSVIPFISRGITVVTTHKNFKRISEYVDSATFKKYGKYIHFVDEDGFTIKDKTNSIVAYKLDKKDYQHIPTEDFLFYYLPKYNYLHTSCMFQRLQGAVVQGKEMISVRVEDVDKLIKTHHLNPAYFITTDTWDDDISGMACADTMAAMYAKGITMTALEDQLLGIDVTTLNNNCDSIVSYLVNNGMPSSIMNSAVYTCLHKKDLQRALSLARIQALINPANLNSWDTYGEVYYFLGNKKMAKRYETQIKRLDKDFTRGGEKVWEQDLKDFQQEWSAL